jgi:hypothetical protein
MTRFMAFSFLGASAGDKRTGDAKRPQLGIRRDFEKFGHAASPPHDGSEPCRPEGIGQAA